MSQVTPKSSAAELLAFVRAVELGGFSAAARDLDLTPSALSKLVARLEARLKVRLMHRTTRRLSLTPEGETFFARGQRILADLVEAEEEAGRSGRGPTGLLRIGVGTAFGMHQFVPALPDFLARHPGLRVEVSVTDRKLDLLEEGADLMLRMGTLVDSSLIARRICDMERVICAAPAYLARHGTPKRPRDLLDHNCLYVSTMPELSRWPFHGETGGIPGDIEVRGNVGSDSAEALLQLALAGTGIIRLSDVIVGDALARGQLVPLLTDCHRVEPVPLYAVYPSGKQRSPKVAAMLDFLIDRFAMRPWRVAPV